MLCLDDKIGNFEVCMYESQTLTILLTNQLPLMQKLLFVSREGGGGEGGRGEGAGCTFCVREGWLTRLDP